MLSKLHSARKTSHPIKQRGENDSNLNRTKFGRSQLRPQQVVNESLKLGKHFK